MSLSDWLAERSVTVPTLHSDSVFRFESGAMNGSFVPALFGLTHFLLVYPGHPQEIEDTSNR